MDASLAPLVQPPDEFVAVHGTPSVSVVIPVYEVTPSLRRTLWSVRNSVDLPTQLVVHVERQSVARNRNAGLAEARHDLVAFVDDDVLLPAGWTSRLVRTLLEDRTIGCVAAKMTGPGGEPQNDLASLRPGELRPCLPPGTCILYSRSRAEGCAFDEIYERSQWEDTDFMLQLMEKGLRCVADGGVHVLHENHFTNCDDASWDRNRQRFLRKWPNIQEVRDRLYGADSPAFSSETSTSYAAS
jgi:glycosyltransferase involved in cell wall biosynthesis